MDLDQQINKEIDEVLERLDAIARKYDIAIWREIEWDYL